jgi:carbon-monoxide dehydrogenase small subunit
MSSSPISPRPWKADFSGAPEKTAQIDASPRPVYRIKPCGDVVAHCRHGPYYALETVEMTVPAGCVGADEESPEMAKISLIVNGKPENANIDPRTLLVQFLRENLRLTGTHVGCDTSQCGACVVHLDGKAVKSCTTLAVMADGHEIRTIEGLAADGGPLHPMQEAFREHHGLQCGFCTPGMIMTAVDIVHRKGHDLSDHTIREELEGNLCRCTGYQNIVLSIAAGAKAMAKSDLA